jgi:S-adenosylmethionine:tRNA-ribosyltransferase-isomerase (queuine synthetase)
MNMTLEFEEAVKVLEEHIEILKQNLLFLMAESKPESLMMTQKIITMKRELDKAVQERMKLSQIYSRHNSSVATPAASAHF